MRVADYGDWETLFLGIWEVSMPKEWSYEKRKEYRHKIAAEVEKTAERLNKKWKEVRVELVP